MFRFSIRELLILTAAVGVCVAWQAESFAWRTESAARSQAHSKTREHAERLRESLRLAERDCDMLIEYIKTGKPRVVCGNEPQKRWELVKQNIP
jgi:hypothetical protein